MARINKAMLTKTEIFVIASQLFLKQGYSNTSVRAIAQELEMSNGNVTFYYPTKEHILADLIHIMCDFQWAMMEKEANEGYSSIMALCLELTAMAAMCEEDEVMKDLYISAYTSPLTLEIIRRNDADRAKKVFTETCADWSDDRFAEAETLVSGIEYATLMTTGDSADLDLRIAGALELILTIYGVPQETRRMKIKKVLALDYREIGHRIIKEFKDYVTKMNTQTIEELIHTSAGF